MATLSADLSLPVWMQQAIAASTAAPSNKDVALQLAKLHIRIFPCNAERSPTIKAWEANSTCDTSKIDGWGLSSIPAIPPGIQGLVVIDCDRKPGQADGVEAFHQLCTEQGIDLSTAFAVDTPTNGRHYYFTTPTAYGNGHSLPAGIDVRGSGGYVIAPGATLPDGRAYRIVSGDWSRIPALPLPLAAFLKERHAIGSSDPAASATALPSVPPSERDALWAAKALEGEVAKVLSAKPGERNNALNKSACTLGGHIGNGSLQRDAVEQALLSASVENGSAAQYGIDQQRKTIRSGIDAGLQKPYPTLAEREAPPVDLSGIMGVNGASQSKPQERKMSLQSFAGIEEQPITWLWNGYLPSAKLTLLAGAGGTGKSTIAFSVAAILTTAGQWPDGTRCEQPGNVVIWSSEDDPADTIKPRLMAMMADTARCYNIAPHIAEDGTKLPFDPSRDMDKLREQVAQLPGGVSLFIIDPIVSAVTGDMNKANDVRRSLQAIVDFAAEQDCAVLGITHFAKGTAGKKSDERVIGSQAFSAFARMVLVAAKEEESDRRVFTRAKSNNSVDTGGFSYEVQMVQGKARSGKQLETTRIVWGEALEGSSRSILAEVEEDVKEDDGSAIGKAKQVLTSLLAHGPMLAKEAEAAAREIGVSNRTLRRAREALKIVVERDKGFHAKVRWSLPYDANAIAQIGGAPIGQRIGGMPWSELTS